MALVAVLMVGLGLPTHASQAQEASPQIPLTVRSGEGETFALTLGLDPEATDGIDPALGEQEQPPVPPSEVFDVRLVDDNVSASGFGEGLLTDIRPGGAQFEGTKQHEIRFQAESGAELTIAWDLPEGITGTIQNVPDGGVYGKSMSGSDSLTVEAGAPNALVTLEYAPNQAPTLDTNAGITLREGGTAPLTTSELSASDPDDAASALTYVVTDGPTQGALVVDGRPDSTFTQADLEGGLVQYDHTAPTATDDSLSFFVEDAGGKTTSTATFSIAVDDVNEPPVLETNSGLALSPGGSATLTSGALRASDPDDEPSALTYVVTEPPTQGDLLVGGRSAASFTQTDLNEGAVQYDHTASSPDDDQFSFVVEDEAGARGPEATFPVAVDPSTHRTTIRGTDGTGNDTGWRLLAPPSNVTRRAFEDDLTFGVNSGALMYTWDGTEWTPAADSSTALPRGEGFILYFFDDELDPISADGLTLEIPDLDEDQTADVTVDGLNTRTSLHLLGNPYDVAFDLDALAGGALSERGFQNTVQVWDPSGEGQWTLITQGGPDDTIPAWQGFFVERARAGRGQTRLTFSADGRQSDPGDLIGSTSALLSATQEKRARLDLSLVVENASDTLAGNDVTLLFHDDAEAGWDAYEATQLPPPTANTYATLSSPLQRDDALVRRTLASEPPPARNETLSYPLSVRSVGTSGTATVRWPESKRALVPRTWTVELLDRNTGAVVDLREAAHTFELAEDTGSLDAPDDARFALRLTPKAGSAEIVDFSAEPTDAGIHLTWETTSEINNTGFHVQRKYTGAQWEQIAFVESSTSKNTTSKSTTTGPRSYQFTDENPPYAIDSLSYRLQHVDTTGTAHTANETDLQFRAPKQITLRPPFPNPSRQHATLHFGLSEATAVQITVYDLLGRSVKAAVQGRFEAGRHQKRLSTSGLAPGMYFVRMQAGGTTRTRKLTVLR